jgi:signal transduction histidine kinase
VTPARLALVAAALLISVAVVAAYAARTFAWREGDEDAIRFRNEVTMRGIRTGESLHEIEASALAYLLTGRSEHYESYMQAKAALPAAARDWKKTLAAHPDDMPRPNPQAAVCERLKYLDTIVDARRRGEGFDPNAYVEAGRDGHAWRLYASNARNAMPSVENSMRDFIESRRGSDRRALFVVTLLAAIATVGAAALILVAGQRMAQSRLQAAESERINADLARARQAAEEATRAKTLLIAAVSHDIRQPLHAVSIYLDILGRKVENTDVAPIIDRISAAMASMSRMSKQLLDISRYDHAVYEAKRERLDLDGIFDAVSVDVGAQAWASGVRLRAVRTSLEPIGDPDLVESIVRNLVWNSIIHARGGRVLVGARRRGPWVDIEVRDDGRGLPDEQLRLFEAGAPRHAIMPSKSGGSGLGLGLALVRRCADLQSARISVESSQYGACFRLRLPRDENVAAPAAWPVPRPTRSDCSDHKGPLSELGSSDSDRAVSSSTRSKA